MFGSDSPDDGAATRESSGSVTPYSPSSRAETDDLMAETERRAAAARVRRKSRSLSRAAEIAELVGRAPPGVPAGAAADVDPNNVAPDLHRDLGPSDWISFHRNLQLLSQRSDLIMKSIMETESERMSTPLHTAAWKAPPSLALLLIGLLPANRGLNGIFMCKDVDYNTALHLSCANLDAKPSTTADSGPKRIDTSVLEALVKTAPKAIIAQNSEGDTPLHMIVSSPAACHAAPSSRSHEEALERAVSTLLDAPDGLGVEACLLQDTSGATPLHVAIASGCADSALLRILGACAAAARVDDNRGMTPLHYAAAFCFQRNQRGGPTPAVVRALLDANPDAVVSTTHNGDTPLHLIVSNSGRSEDDIGGSSELDGPITRIVEMIMGGRRREEAEVDGEDDDGHEALVDYGSVCPLIMTNREKVCFAFFRSTHVSLIFCKARSVLQNMNLYHEIPHGSHYETVFPVMAGCCKKKNYMSHLDVYLCCSLCFSLNALLAWQML